MWQPYETMPRDGTPVLIYDGRMICVATCEDCKRSDGSEYTNWRGVGESGCDSDVDYNYGGITHWMPLPEAPTNG